MINGKETDLEGTHLFHLSKHLLSTSSMPSTAVSLEAGKILERKLGPRYCPPENPMGCQGGVAGGLLSYQRRVELCELYWRRGALRRGDWEVLWKAGFCARPWKLLDIIQLVVISKTK